MPLFQDFGKHFIDAAKVVSKRTAEATEVVRLNARQSALQDEIERMFNQVGKAYYAMRGAGGECEAANALCAKAEALTAELESVKAELDRLRNLRRCPSCAEVQASSAVFCANCGTKMPVPEPEPAPQADVDAIEQPQESWPREPQAQPEVEINWPKPKAEPQPEPEPEPEPAEDEDE